MTINCRGQLLDFTNPKVMGIINITPDSFYDGGVAIQEATILLQAEKMLTEGADILDIGGMSSRPGAKIISVEEELSRVLPATKSILQKFPKAIISIDTLRAKVAEECLKVGAHIINDISAGRFDAEMIAVVAKHKAPFIIMHMQGLPATMQQLPVYNNIVNEVMDFFAERIAICKNAGIIDLILDVGFGFGKTTEHNYTLLKNMQYFSELKLPILAGVSRKSMICKVLQVNPDNALNGTTSVNTIALSNGASILRVHDVKEAKQVVAIVITLNAN